MRVVSCCRNSLKPVVMDYKETAFFNSLDYNLSHNLRFSFNIYTI